MQFEKQVQIKEKLSEFIDRNKLVSIFDNVYKTDKFIAGFILNVSDEFVLVAHVDSFGFYDGYLVKQLNKIYNIEFDGKYEKKLLTLYKLQNQSHKKVAIDSSSIIIDLLNHAKNNNLAISAELYNSGTYDVQGLIENLNESTITVKLIDDYGCENGMSMFNINNITSLICDSDIEISLKLLNENMGLKFI